MAYGEESAYGIVLVCIWKYCLVSLQYEVCSGHLAEESG